MCIHSPANYGVWGSIVSFPSKIQINPSQNKFSTLLCLTEHIWQNGRTDHASKKWLDPFLLLPWYDFQWKVSSWIHWLQLQLNIEHQQCKFSLLETRIMELINKPVNFKNNYPDIDSPGWHHVEFSKKILNHSRELGLVAPKQFRDCVLFKQLQTRILDSESDSSLQWFS